MCESLGNSLPRLRRKAEGPERPVSHTRWRVSGSADFGEAIAPGIRQLLPRQTLESPVSAADGGDWVVWIDGGGRVSSERRSRAIGINLAVTASASRSPLEITLDSYRYLGSAGAVGLHVGITLTLIHLISIPVDNTSVNPVRSFGMAIFAGSDALEQLWAFIVFPLIGAIVGVLLWLAITDADLEDSMLAGTPLVRARDAMSGVGDRVEAVLDLTDSALGGTDLHPYGPGSHAVMADGSMPEGYPVKGNVDSMLYHRTDSRNYGATVAEVWFDASESAEEAGFSAAATHPTKAN